MKIIKLSTVSITATNATDSTPTWDIATAYPVNFEVQKANKIYVCAIANTGVDPTTDTTPPTKWTLRGSTNPYKMTDGKQSTQTTTVGDLTFTLSIADADYLAFFNVESTEITAVIKDDTGATVDTKTLTALSLDNIADEYDWCFAPTMFLRTLSTTFPAIQNGTIDVTVKAGSGGNARVGVVAAGYGIDCGLTLRDPSPGVSGIFYSKQQEDNWGESTYIAGAATHEIDLRLSIDPFYADYAEFLLREEIGNQTAVFIADERDTAAWQILKVYGYIKTYKVNLASGKSFADLTLRRLI
jgi:hypothetical protein